METTKLIEEIKKTNKECLCELIANNMHLVTKLSEIKEEEEKKYVKKLILNSLAIVKWNINTML